MFPHSENRDRDSTFRNGIAVEIKWINPGKITFLEIPNIVFS